MTFFAILVLWSAATARAQQAGAAPDGRDPHEVQPERPTVATHAGTVAPGWLEIETGGEWDRYSGGGKVLSFPTVIKFGLASKTQLNISAAVFHGIPGDESVNGIGDVTVGVKYRLLDDAPIVGDFAILPTIKFPTASSARGLGTGTTDVSLLLISSHDLGPVALDINVGVSQRSGDGSNAPKVATVWTVSTGFPVSGQLGWVAEIFGFPGTKGEAGVKGTAALLTGPTFQFAQWFVMDAGIIAPLVGPQPKALYAGFVWNVGKLP